MIKLLDNVCLVQCEISERGQVITGKVIDAELFEGMCGVAVLQQGTTNGTITDLDGKYSLGIQPSGRKNLEFTYVGYIPVVANFKEGDARINIIMFPD